MEGLIEVLLEIVLELFGELIFEAIANMFASLFRVFETNNQTKRRIKYTLIFIFFALVLCFLIYSVIIKQGLFIKIVLIYLIIMLFVYFFKFINRNLLKNKFNHLIKVITTVMHYLLSISIIVAIAINRITRTGIFIIILSSLSLFVLIIIDIFRIKRSILEKKSKKNNNEEINNY